MITDDEIQKLKEAGKIAATARKLGTDMIKEDVLLIEVLEKVEDKIAELGGKPAFPAQISIGSTAAHACAQHKDNYRFAKGDICKLDVGVQIDGFIGDTASTVDLGDNKDLVKASRRALEAAIAVSKPGAKLRDIGAAINDAISSMGFQPIRNLSGHGLGLFDVHTKPSVPNFDNGDDTEIKKGMVLAIEPFATTGAGMITEKGDAEVFQLIQKKPVRQGFVRDILKMLEDYEGLPFAKRWIAAKFGLPKTNYALMQLEKIGSLHAYPPLVERSDGLVSQAEQTIIVLDEPIVTTKLD